MRSRRLKTAGMRVVSVLLALVAGLGLAVQSADAQYFGRNKVQYEDLDFKVLRTTHFDIYYYEKEREAIEYAARMAERWYYRLSRLLNHEFGSRQPLILYASHPHFRQTNVIRGLVGQGTGGVTEPLKRRVVMPFASSLAETDHVLGHELVHAFQFDMARAGAGRMSLWFAEGMAEYLSLGPIDAHTAMWMRDALKNDRLPSVKQLDNPRFFPYRYGHAFFSYLAGRYGDAVIGEILRRAGGMRGGSRGAVLGYTELSAKELTKAWHSAIAEAYEPLQEMTRGPEEYGRLLLGEKQAGRMNLAPALSPDGQRIAFVSEKSQFAIEIFLADAETGEVQRKLVETAVDPHFESLQFINSAGAWDPEGRRFVFAAISGGQPVLTIRDVARKEKERELKFKDLGEVFNPTWSPDGRYIAFSAIVGGVSDIYVYDLQENRRHQLTDDPYADLQPAWSPLGDRIAFVTDRFSSDLGSLEFGNYRLGLLDPETGRIREGPSFSRGKHTNPQWSPGGQSLYFLSDLNGITNLYRVDLDSGRFTRLTNLYTGISGITALSPALSVAAGSGELAFSVYQNSDYAIYKVEAPEELAGDEAVTVTAETNPALLPPAERQQPILLALLQDPQEGLPPDTTYATRDYSAGLSLDYVAQPTVVAGADQFGSFIGGGTAVFFSDMLGHHSLGTLLQVNGSFEDLTAAVAYQNQSKRLIWGGTAQRVPLRFGAFSLTEGTLGGERVFIQRSVIFRQTHYRLVGTAWYPFSRVQRLEFSAGYRHIGFELEVDSLIFGPDGTLLAEGQSEQSPFDALDLGTASAALVYDNSLFGATSPILGQRYRLEAAPQIGSITYVEALADYRKYFMFFRPFTLALRGLHFGRYGGDADDPRVSDLFIGFQGLVRGYPRGSFTAGDCNPTPTDPCPVFNQLLGTRIAVANAELRFPLFGALGIGGGYYGFLPIEMAFFGDAGVAWRSDVEATPVDEQAFFLGGDREPVYSAGVTLRTNIGGYIVLQLDFARAFERDEWVTQFGLLPGF